jgi:hypothetical protein
MNLRMYHNPTVIYLQFKTIYLLDLAQNLKTMTLFTYFYPEK